MTEQSRHAGRESESEQHAYRAHRPASGPMVELWHFPRRSRKWWMTPILLALLTTGAVVVVGGSALAGMSCAIFEGGSVMTSRCEDTERSADSWPANRRAPRAGGYVDEKKPPQLEIGGTR